MDPLELDTVIEIDGEFWEVTAVIDQKFREGWAYDLRLVNEPTTTWYAVRDDYLDWARS